MLAYFVVISFAYVLGVHGTCLDLSSSIDQSLIASMCHNSVVEGTMVYIDTDVATTTTLTSGTACTCTVHAQTSESVRTSTYFGHVKGSGCGTSVKFSHVSSNFSVPCNDFPYTFPTNEHSDITIGLEKTAASGIGDYCIILTLIAADTGSGTLPPPLITVTCAESQFLPQHTSPATSSSTTAKTTTTSSTTTTSTTTATSTSSVTTAAPATTTTKTSTTHSTAASFTPTVTSPTSTAKPTASATTSTASLTTSGSESTESPDSTSLSSPHASTATSEPSEGGVTTAKKATDDDDDEDDDEKDIIITGIVVGVLALLLIIFAIVYFCRTKNVKRSDNGDKENGLS